MNTISGHKLRQMLVLGANKLEANKETVNEMNVFPVPDGDTGTNMSLTMTSAVKEVLSVTSDSVSDIAKALSSGALRGARGNSGVILSQLFRGLYKGVKGSAEMQGVLFANAMQRGVETAYKAVMKPKEGTILTVAREAAAFGQETALAVEDVALIMEAIKNTAEESLKKTPELLPVLKEAGVVDSGGYGLVLIYQGFLEALQREDDELEPLLALQEPGEKGAVVKQAAEYCTEITVATNKSVEEVTALLKDLGTDMIVAQTNQTIQVMIHSKNPGAILSKITEIGDMTFTKVENMAISHNHVLNLKKEEPKEEPRKETGFITISVGEGLKNIFTELGVDYVISGGQTMNPSTDDILHAASLVNADDIFVLPNNKNIILAAQQAEKMIRDKRLHVIPTKSIPQGIAAMISYMPGESVKANIQSMKDGIEAVVSGSVTYSIRDTKMGEFDIKEGDYLGIQDGDLSYVSANLMDTSRHLIDSMVSDETSIITIYFGSDASLQEAEELRDYVFKTCPGVEVEIQEGDQPIYYFLLSAE